jgi:two-component system NtrC family sensor kinase
MTALMRILRSVRVRLLVIALLPMLVLLPIMLGSTMMRWSGKIDDLLITKVNGDLTIADQFLARLLENSGERLDAIAKSVSLQDALLNSEEADKFLEHNRQSLGLDFLYLTDGVIGPDGFDVSQWPVVQKAIDGSWQSAVDVLTPDQLEALKPGLADSAAIPLVTTRAAVPTTRKTETRGMIIHSAAPVIKSDGKKAALVGGLLLNRNLDFIDTINALVYQENSLPEGSQGTATLFLEDVRISTNVRLFENVRALGTRVSAQVRSRVLDDNQTWLDRAFVVNDWYISAYEPIMDSRGKAVGMLYVGFLEAPFQQEKINSALMVVLLFLLITAVSVPIFLRWAGRIFLPLERMTQTMLRVEAGDMEARNMPQDEDNEIAQVAGHLDDLLDQVQERDRQLRQWGEQLNVKVEERTRDLLESNRKLEQTTERLIISEKLAAVGEITAGVAHEINNPIAVIQGNMDVARTLLGSNVDVAKTEFKLIDDQVYRIGSIVSKLLQFARPEEYSGDANIIYPAEIVSDCLVLTSYQIDAQDIEVHKDLDQELCVLMSRTELQQVIVNLILNAEQAMPDGGTLSLAVRSQGTDVEISVEDTGVGIPPDTVKRIFDAFFTTKYGQGTGLGLSISQTIVSRAKGQITVRSQLGAGSCFTINLPAAEFGDSGQNVPIVDAH